MPSYHICYDGDKVTHPINWQYDDPHLAAMVLTRLANNNVPATLTVEPDTGIALKSKEHAKAMLATYAAYITSKVILWPQVQHVLLRVSELDNDRYAEAAIRVRLNNEETVGASIALNEMDHSPDPRAMLERVRLVYEKVKDPS